MFSVSTDPRDGFLRDSSLKISLLSVAGFSLLITVSCDEDDEEVRVWALQRNSLIKQGQRMVRSSLYCN